jgi:hypothetical protein
MDVSMFSQAFFIRNYIFKDFQLKMDLYKSLFNKKANKIPI